MSMLSAAGQEAAVMLCSSLQIRYRKIDLRDLTESQAEERQWQEADDEVYEEQSIGLRALSPFDEDGVATKGQVRRR